MMSMNEQRLIQIEEKLAYQEHALEQVSQVLTNQQAELDRLRQQCHSLARRLSERSEPQRQSDSAEDVPPHY